MHAVARNHRDADTGTNSDLRSIDFAWFANDPDDPSGSRAPFLHGAAASAASSATAAERKEAEALRDKRAALIATLHPNYAPRVCGRDVELGCQCPPTRRDSYSFVLFDFVRVFNEQFGSLGFIGVTVLG
jgi:hypothetical protein